MSLLSNRYEEHRPWGSFERFTENEPSTVKILHIDANKELSLQKHTHRSEWWKVIGGDGVAHVGDKEWQISMNDEIEIPPETLHRLRGGEQGVAVLEISIGNFDENDIERVEDDFGRV